MSELRPTFTVVTPALNCGDLLPRNIQSVWSQGLEPGELEHWVIDGGSKDQSLEVLLAHPQVKYISEKDKGLSDAVNKGIQRATGEWIIWLNADDELAPGALQAFKKAARENPGVFLFCGRQNVLGYDGTIEDILEPPDYTLDQLLGTQTSIIQASTFAHRSVYEKVGLLDVSIRYAMDYEWTVRAAREFKSVQIPVILTHYHRRKGSIMDANMAAHYRTFLKVRRQLKQPYFALGEFRIRFYLATEPLRRMSWLRKSVRAIKRLFGQEPIHPMS